MSGDPENWQAIAAWIVGLFAALIVLYLAWSTLQARAEARRRIGAARVRSGHVPLEIPSVRGDLGEAPDTFPEWARQGRSDRVVVDEQPRIHIRYVDMFGKLAERTIQVEHVDLQRRTIVARGESMDDPRLFPIEKIRLASNVETGKAFNLDTWIDAVRVARRRRESSVSDYDDAQFV